MTTATESARLDATQLNALTDAIRRVGNYLPHHKTASVSLRAWLKRTYRVRHLHELPVAKLPEVMTRLDTLRQQAVRHCASLWALEGEFLRQSLGERLDPQALTLESEVVA